jgi:uncharacterized membrane protein
MTVLLKLSITFLVLFFLTAPVAFFAIGKRWQFWGVAVHWGSAALGAACAAAHLIFWVWSQ